MPSDGDHISVWPDLSGHHHDFSCAGGSTAPVFNTNVLNGLAGVKWDGGATVTQGLLGPDLSGVLASAVTMFIVFRFDPFHDPQNAYVWFTSDHESGSGHHHDQWWRFNSDGAGYWSVFRTSRISGYPAAPSNTGSHYFVLKSGATDYRAYLDSVAQAAQAAAYEAPVEPALGYPSSGQWNAYPNGWVCEFILFDSELSDADRTGVEGYLAAKFGLTASGTPKSPDLVSGLVVWLAPEAFITTERRVASEAVEVDAVADVVQRRLADEVVEADVVALVVQRRLGGLVVEVDYVQNPETPLSAIGGIPSREAWGVPTLVRTVDSGSTTITGGGTIGAEGLQRLFTQVIGEAATKKQLRRRPPGEAWAADTPISQPEALDPDHPILVDFGGVGFTAGGLAHALTQADKEQTFTPAYTPKPEGP